MPDENKDQGDVTMPTLAPGVTAISMTETLEEAKARLAAPEPNTDTAETLGVDQASYDKYYKDGKFNWEDFGKEQAFKAKQSATKDEGEPKDKSKAPKHSQTAEAEDLANKAGLDWDALGTKISSDGDISPEDYTALENIGVPRHVITGYVEAIKGQAQDLIDDIIDAAGGQDEFDKVFDALAEKPMSIRKQIDALLLDPATREDGVTMMFKHAGVERPTDKPNTPTDPKVPAQRNGAVNQGQGGDPSVKGFSSFEEQMQAQRDPRYKSDVAYRNEVMGRIAVSTYELNPRQHQGGL